MLAIELDELRPENGGQIAGSVAPGHVHLPETVLGSDVTLGEEKIGQVGGGDVGNAERVVGHDDGTCQSGKMNRAVYLRQRRPHRPIKPEIEGEEGDQQQEQNSHHRRER